MCFLNCIGHIILVGGLTHLAQVPYMRYICLSPSGEGVPDGEEDPGGGAAGAGHHEPGHTMWWMEGFLLCILQSNFPHLHGGLPLYKFFKKTLFMFAAF